LVNTALLACIEVFGAENKILKKKVENGMPESI
jgi:hypothetical protein